MNAPDTLTAPIDVAAVRTQFPVLAQRVHEDKRLAYLDNAATTQKPEAVLKVIDGYYRFDNSNVHRGVHALAARATQAYEDARATIARFCGHTPEATVFTRGTTEAINLVAYSYLLPRLEAGDEIRSTNISPGAIETELTSTITDPDAKQAADELYKVAIDSDAVARAIVYAIEQPADVDINEIILRPTAQEL